MDELVSALLVVLILMLAYLGVQCWKKKWRHGASGFVGLPKNAWPGPLMTFPAGEVWPGPSYY